MLCAACVQKPPHATVIVHAGRAPTSHAVLVVPTQCVSYAYVGLCQPSSWASSKDETPRLPASFGEVIDPALRLKLEFAGFTLAEAGALRLGTAERVDVTGGSHVTEAEGPRTVAELGFDDARAVARSLSLTSVLVPQLTIRPDGPGTNSGELTVALIDAATNEPRWTVSCKEKLYDVFDTPNRLANCVGNGVLAVLAPENLIGRAL